MEIFLKILIPLLVVVASIVVFFLRWRKDSNSAWFFLCCGIIVADLIFFIAVLPGDIFPDLINIGIFNSLQLGTLNVDVNSFIGSEGAIKDSLHLKIVFFILSTLTPLTFAIFLLSFINSVWTRIIYFLLNLKHDVYIFSEINEQSICLARDIKNNEKNPLIVFCQKECDDESLLSEAKQNKFFLMNRVETSFVKKSRHKRYFFALSNDDSKNFQVARELIKEYEKLNFEQLDNPEIVKVFVKSEGLLSERSMDSREKEAKSITVTFINKSETAANELLFEHPLYNVFDDEKKHLEMLIAGTTAVADKILKLSLSCSQLGQDYTSKFIVVDKDATGYKERLAFEAPELFSGEYEIEFFDAEIGTVAFQKILDEKCSGVNYVAVCAGDDDFNFRTAVALRSHFIRVAPENEKQPFIGMYLEKSDKDATKELRAAPKEKYELTAFGNLEDVFSYDLLVASEFEKIALNVHACYSFVKNAKSHKTVKEIIQSFNRSETDRKSNRANAVHIRYKLFILGYEMKLKKDATVEEIEKSKALAAELKSKLSDKKILNNLSKIEHLRWAAHERGDGWISVSKEIAKSRKEKIGVHKFNIAKMHPCLCDWEELDELGKAIGGDPEMFKEYDIQICEFLLAILGLEENKDINISCAEYVLVER